VDPTASSRPSRESGSRGRWSSFVADVEAQTPRALHEIGNPAHRLRVEHNKKTLLIHLSGEDGDGWTVVAVDRETRTCVVAHSQRQLEAAERAYRELYSSLPNP
jgi:hypothetical protein